MVAPSPANRTFISLQPPGRGFRDLYTLCEMMIISAAVSTTASTTVPLLLTGMCQALSPRSCATALTDGTTRSVIVIGWSENFTRFLSLVFGGARGLGDGERLSADIVRLGHSRLKCPIWLHD